MDGIKFVINFDYPQNSEDYIHRIGRTGRSDTTGTSYALFTDANAKQAKDLLAVLREANQVFGRFGLFLSAWTNYIMLKLTGNRSKA